MKGINSDSYKLIINLENEGKEIIAPSASLIEKYLDKLSLFFENFIILESNNKINDFTFIQTVAEFEEDTETFANLYWVEAQREEFVKNKKILRQYGYEVSRENLLKIFTSYLSGITPDVSQWEHICDIDPDEIE